MLEPLQKNALKIAKDAAAEFKDLDLMVCGDVANTNIFDPNDKNSFKECQKMYEEQVLWAKEAGVDFVVAETINWVDEMKIAFKPTASIGKEQKTVNAEGKEVLMKAKGRHDPCVLPRAVPMVDAMVALVLADHLLLNQAQCGLMNN